MVATTKIMSLILHKYYTNMIMTTMAGMTATKASTGPILQKYYRNILMTTTRAMRHQKH